MQMEGLPDEFIERFKRQVDDLPEVLPKERQRLNHSHLTH